jgi:hypothetical protein
MMIVMMVAMIAAITWEYAAAQQDGHRCSKD